MGLLTALYNTALKPVTESVGLHGAIEDVYWRGCYRRHSGVESHTIDGTTARFHVNTHSECRRLSELMGESDVIADLLTELRPDDVVYDIGANIGMYTCFLAKRLPSEQVVAIEPHPANVNALQSNLDLNETDTTILDKALSDTSGTMDLAVESSVAGEGAHALDTGNAGRTIEVPVTTGDEIAGTEVPTPTVVKIDVEGAERRVLEGCSETLSRPECRCCYVELHPDRLPDFGDSAEAVTEFLSAAGFKLTTLQDRESELFIKARKPR